MIKMCLPSSHETRKKERKKHFLIIMNGQRILTYNVDVGVGGNTRDGNHIEIRTRPKSERTAEARKR